VSPEQDEDAPLSEREQADYDRQGDYLDWERQQRESLPEPR
jgi:hypothetical protein